MGISYKEKVVYQAQFDRKKGLIIININDGVRGKRNSKAKWTATEDDYLREHYGKVAPSEMLHLLKSRSRVSIRKRAARLGLQSSLNC